MPPTCTAQITVGVPMPYASPGGLAPEIGIGPERIMYLVEGSEGCAWVLESVIHSSEKPLQPKTWVASRSDRILADALVMIAVLVEESAEVRDLIEDRLGPKQSRKLFEAEWSDHLAKLADQVLDEVEDAAHQLVRSKLVITVMDGSYITGQLASLDRCSMEAEVCTVSWIRKLDNQGKGHVAGTLPPEGHSFRARLA